MATAPDQYPDLLGRYRIGAPLGQGGFAVVLRAHDEGLDAPVAIKVLDRERAFDPDLRERFVREARLLRRVQNPNVVSVFDIGELDDGRPYFVMEFAGGGSIGERFADIRATNTDIQAVVLALRSGLGALHRAGIVHRDVKPDNLLIGGEAAAGATRIGPDHLDDDERVLIGDLGLAKDQLTTGAAATIVGGTPRFRAPEQLDETAAVTPATDTFAATGVVWQLVTGTLPPDDLEPELGLVDEGWAAFFRQGLAARPGDRFESIDQWAEAALAVVDHQVGSLTHSSAPIVAAGVCPYKGLAAYQPEDAALYFGREALIDELVSRLQLLPTLVVAGPSGSGKSSLVRAGLIPAVERGALSGSHQWPVALMTPGVDPLGNLHRHLVRIGPELVPPLDALVADPRAIRSALPPGGALLVIDQFEEVFTAPARDEHAMVALLAELTRPEHQVRLVLALRADFYDRCAAHPWLARVINDNQVLVGPMQRSELRRAIEAPARRAGLRFEDGLVEQILDDAGTDSGALPLVAHALMETWLRRRGNELTRAGYDAAGGVTGAIAQSAETAFARLDPAQAASSRQLFLRLVNPTDDNVITRRHLPISDVDAGDRAIVDDWAGARLLTVDDNGVEITHEAMLTTWPRLRQWIDESRDDLRTRQRITRATEGWRANERDPDLLYRGTPLDAALGWANDHRADLGADELEFLDASRDQRDAEQAAADAAAARQQTRRRRAVTALAVLATVAVLASVAAVIALAQSRRDEQRAVEAEEEANLRLAESVARQGNDDDPLLAVMLAAEATARAPSAPVGALGALVSARVRAAEPGPLPISDVPVTEALRVDISDDGSAFAVGTRSGDIELGSTTQPGDRQVLSGHSAGIEAVAFSPLGTQLASTGIDGTVRVWDITASPPAARTITDMGAFAWDLAYDPSGELIAVVSEAGEVRVLDAQSGDTVQSFEAGMGVDLLSVTFSPDGDTLVAGSGSGAVYGWSVSDGSVRFAGRQAHTSDVWELVFDATGERLATVSSDGRLRVWSVAALVGDDAMPDPMTEPLTIGDQRLVQQAIGAVWFAADTIVVGTDDGSLWQIDTSGTNEPRPVLTALHDDRVIDLAASADGTALVSVADDQVVWLLDNDVRPSSQIVADLRAPGFSLAASPDGTRLAAGTGDGTVVVFAPDGTELARLDGPQELVAALSFVDDQTLVAGDQEGSIHLLDVDRGLMASVSGHDGPINGLAVDPSSGRVVTVGGDAMVRAWTADDLDEVGAVTAPAEPTAVAIVADGEAVIGFAQGDLARWSVGDADVAAPTSVDRSRIWHITVDRERGLLALSTDSERVVVTPIDSPDQPVAELSDLVGGSTASAFLADGEVVAALSRAGGVRYLDVASGQPIGSALTVHEDEAWALVVLPDGARTFTTAADGTVRLTDVLDRAAACELAGVALADPARRQRYLSDTELVACEE
ncbi:MAG: protein kinase [Acidimicrobiia bacterium]|nr:protein kinase [Acidimicrobiia bacterium]